MIENFSAVLGVVTMASVIVTFFIARWIGSEARAQTKEAQAFEAQIRAYAQAIREGRAYAATDQGLTPEAQAQGLIIGWVGDDIPEDLEMALESLFEASDGRHYLDPHCPECGSARCMKGFEGRDYCHVPEHMDDILDEEGQLRSPKTLH